MNDTCGSHVGFKRMMYDCDEKGCFNDKHRLDFGVFYPYIPERYSFSDIDAVLEIGGRFFFIEAKDGEPRELKYGQRKMLEMLTALSPNVHAVVVCGDISTMQFTHAATVSNGKMGRWEPCDTLTLCERLAVWSHDAHARKSATARATVADADAAQTCDQ